MSNTFEKNRGKLNINSNKNINGDDNESMISKDSNPKEDDDHEEYYQEQDYKNMTSKLMNQDLLNQLEQDSHPPERDSILGKTMTSMGKTMQK